LADTVALGSGCAAVPVKRMVMTANAAARLGNLNPLDAIFSLSEASTGGGEKKMKREAIAEQEE
jgi:hypothetical protein